MTIDQNVQSQYDALCDSFFDAYYTYHPSHATRQGLHQYDHHLGHYQRDQIDETLQRMKACQRQLAQIDPQGMDHWHRLDYPVLATRIKREIYWVETWRHWERN